MGSQVELHQIIQNFDHVVQVLAFDRVISFEFGKALEKATRDNIVIDPGLGIMAHIKTLADPPQHQHPNIHRQLIIQLANNLPVMQIPRPLLRDKLLTDLQLHRYAITECVDFLIRSGSTRPLYPSQLVGIRF